MSVETYNGKTQTNTATTGAGNVSVATSTTVLAAANPNRTALYISNDDTANIVYLGLGTAAVANKGIRVNAAGGGVVITAFTGAINAIAVGGTANVCVADI